MNWCFPSSCTAHPISVWKHALVMADDGLSSADVYIHEYVKLKVNSDLLVSARGFSFRIDLGLFKM